VPKAATLVHSAEIFLLSCSVRRRIDSSREIKKTRKADMALIASDMQHTVDTHQAMQKLRLFWVAPLLLSLVGRIRSVGRSMKLSSRFRHLHRLGGVLKEGGGVGKRGRWIIWRRRQETGRVCRAETGTRY
jgi:hypothetical protein